MASEKTTEWETDFGGYGQIKEGCGKNGCEIDGESGTCDGCYAVTHYQMYWFLNTEENVDSIKFDTLEDYMEWIKENPHMKPTKQTGLKNTGVQNNRGGLK
jgi:hypothetical protein